MPQKGQITQWINHLLDWVKPGFVYEVVNTDSHYRPGYFFRTERAAYKYIEQQEMTDPYIYNGVYSLELRKHKYNGEGTDRKA